ncbi:hypothetical protein ACFXJ5_28635 [Streptomyces sp. NPDC059373]
MFRAALLLLAPAVFVLLQLTAASQWTFFPDSYRYARAAEQYLGESRTQAHRTALAAFCASRADQAAAASRLDPLGESPGVVKGEDEKRCLARWADAVDITTGDPRYQAIFSSRPGYPLVAAPFVGAFGVLRGMRLLGLLTAAGGSLMVAGLLRGAGLSWRGAVGGQVAFLASPLGWWSMQALGEGLFTLCSFGALWGAVLLFRRRPAAGGSVMAASLALGAVTRYSSILVLAALLAAVAVAAAAFSRRLRHSGTALLAAMCGTATLATAAAMRLLGLPSSEITLQDTFTRHFRHPDVPDPWGRLFALAGRFWTHWFAEQAAMPYFLLLTALAAWALVTYGAGLGWPVLAAAVTGAVLVTGHPLAQEAGRLGVLMWTPVVLGLPLLLEPRAVSSRVGVAVGRFTGELQDSAHSTGG